MDVIRSHPHFMGWVSDAGITVLDLPTALQLAAAKYVFKVIVAVVDTPFIYWARSWGSGDNDWQDDAMIPAAKASA